MAKVTGRTDDMLIIRGVNVFPSQIEELIVGQLHLAPHYVLEVRREGALDQLEVMVELDPRRRRTSRPIRDEAARDLRRRIKSYIGVTASVSVCNPGDHRAIGRKGEARGRPARVAATDHWGQPPVDQCPAREPCGANGDGAETSESQAVSACAASSGVAP